MTAPTPTPGVDSGSPAGGGDDLVIRIIERAERAAERRALERVYWAIDVQQLQTLDYSKDYHEGLRDARRLVQRLLDEVRP